MADEKKYIQIGKPAVLKQLDDSNGNLTYKGNPIGGGSSDDAIKFPTNKGTNGQFLSTDGNNNVSWKTPSGGGGGTSFIEHTYSDYEEIITPSGDMPEFLEEKETEFYKLLMANNLYVSKDQVNYYQIIYNTETDEGGFYRHLEDSETYDSETTYYRYINNEYVEATDITEYNFDDYKDELFVFVDNVFDEVGRYLFYKKIERKYFTDENDNPFVPIGTIPGDQTNYIYSRLQTTEYSFSSSDVEWKLKLISTEKFPASANFSVHYGSYGDFPLIEMNSPDGNMSMYIFGEEWCAFYFSEEALEDQTQPYYGILTNPGVYMVSPETLEVPEEIGYYLTQGTSDTIYNLPNKYSEVKKPFVITLRQNYSSSNPMYATSHKYSEILNAVINNEPIVFNFVDNGDVSGDWLDLRENWVAVKDYSADKYGGVITFTLITIPYGQAFIKNSGFKPFDYKEIVTAYAKDIIEDGYPIFFKNEDSVYQLETTYDSNKTYYQRKIWDTPKRTITVYVCKDFNSESNDVATVYVKANWNTEPLVIEANFVVGETIDSVTSVRIYKTDVPKYKIGYALRCEIPLILKLESCSSNAHWLHLTDYENVLSSMIDGLCFHGTELNSNFYNADYKVVTVSSASDFVQGVYYINSSGSYQLATTYDPSATYYIKYFTTNNKLYHYSARFNEEYGGNTFSISLMEKVETLT